MKITFLLTGKTSSDYLAQGMAVYQKRLAKYTNFELHILPDVKCGKKTNPEALKAKEGEQLLKQLAPADFLVLLDEAGKTYSSTGFADQLQQWQNRSIKKLCFAIGGAYGFSPEVYQRADAKISLSKMTFSHQLVRLVFLEQLYRAFSILNNEPYHHE